MVSAIMQPIVRFGLYEMDLRSGDLRRSGVRIVLQHQPHQILEMLLSCPGDVVTRDQIQTRLWPSGTFVDFSHSINAAVRRLRRVLEDTAETPRFIETLPRRGYRRIAQDAVEPAEMGRARTKLAVLPFWAISTSVGPDDPFAEGLTEETMARLAQHCAPVVGVVSRRALGTGLDDSSTLRHLRDALHVDYVVEGRVRRVANRVRITSQLVDAIDATHLWAEVYEDDCSDSLLAQQRVAQAIATAVATRLATAYVASASLTA